MVKNKILAAIIIMLIIIELILCSYILYKELSPNKTCSSGESCNDVQESVYGNVIGIKWPYIGLVSFAILLIFFFANIKLFKIAAVIGGCISLYLVFIQLFIIKEICINCMEVHIVMFLILILSFFYKKNNVPPHSKE